MKQLWVPFYENLNIKTFLHKALQWPGLKDYLPDGPDLDRVNRKWLINVIYTIVGEEFNDWVQREVNARNNKVTDTQKMNMEMDPGIAACWEASNHVSSKYHLKGFSFILILCLLSAASKGKGVDMCKPGSKRRRTKRELA